MCGIGGVIDFERPVGDPAGVAGRFHARLAHRGPDGNGAWSEGGVVLAHCRLAMVARPRRAGNWGDQPLVSPDGRFVLVYNGEVYNRSELGGGRTDTEAVLAWLARKGIQGVDALDGMFALCLWDRKERRAWLVRDRLGVKPLVYTVRDGAVWFASEARALVDGPELDVDAFAEWVVMPPFSGAVSTMFRGVHVVPPGGVVEVSADGVRVDRWFTWETTDDPVAIPELREALVGSIRAAAAAEVGVAGLLSGGIDSTLVCAVGRPARTFTALVPGAETQTYADSLITGEDDLPWAREAAAELDLEHEVVPLARKGLPDRIDTVARADRLAAWEQELTQQELYAAVRASGCGVVLVGDAADETWHGYHFALAARPTESPIALVAQFGAQERVRLVNPGYLDPNRLIAEVADRYVDGGWKGAESVTRLIRERWLERLMYNGDIHSMAHSLENRVPFASRALVRLAQRTPVHRGFVGGVTKVPLREAATGLIPDQIRMRKKSALPKDQDCTAVYQRLGRALLADPAGPTADVLNLDTVRELVTGPLDEVRRSMLFQALVFDRWVRHHGVHA